MGLENVKWMHLLAKVTLPVPTKPVLPQKKRPLCSKSTQSRSNLEKIWLQCPEATSISLYFKSC